MTETLAKLLLRLSEADRPILWGRVAAPHFGREFERLLARQVLVEEAPAETWDVCGACECGLDARPIQEIGEQRIAVCPLDRRADVHLSDDDIRSFRIDVGLLMGEIAKASSFPEAPADVMPGLWHLGLAASGRAVFIVSIPAAVRQPGLFSAIRATARSAPITVFTPPLPASECLQFDEAGMHRVTTREMIGTRHDTASPFGIDPACFMPDAGNRPRLVIVQSNGTVILDDLRRSLSGQPFRLLLLLAEKMRGGRTILSSREIETHTNREPRDLVRELRDGLGAGHPDAAAVRGLIKNVRNPPGYTLALAADEIDLRP